MIMYLYGADAYARTAALREKIVAPYFVKHPDGMVSRFYLDEEDSFLKLKEFVGASSLFAKVKLAVVYEPGKAEEKDLIALLKNVLEDKGTTIVIVAEKKLVKAFDFLLKEPVKTYEFEPLAGAKLTTFLQKEVHRLELKVSDEAVKQAVALYGGDTWAAMTELQNLANGSTIAKASSTPDFFPMMQALKSASPASRLKALFYALETVEPAAAFNMLATLVSGADKIKMADYDVAIKSGKLEYEEALLDFVI